MSFIFLIIGFVFLIKGADLFVEGASSIAKKFNVNVSTIYELLKRYHVKCNRYNHSKSVQTPVKG